jgi:hypothetical protein
VSVKPIFVVCVFNVYSEEPDCPSETAEERAARKRTCHFTGFTADEADEAAERSLHNSSAHNWWPAVLLGEFPIATDAAGQEFIDAEVTCPRCGNAF